MLIADKLTKFGFYRFAWLKSNFCRQYSCLAVTKVVHPPDSWSYIFHLGKGIGLRRYFFPFPHPFGKTGHIIITSKLGINNNIFKIGIELASFDHCLNYCCYVCKLQFFCQLKFFHERKHVLCYCGDNKSSFVPEEAKRSAVGPFFPSAVSWSNICHNHPFFMV